MSLSGSHLIDLKKFNYQYLLNFFKKVDSFKAKAINKNACMLFLEPSTRTQLSFDLAFRDNGIIPVVFPENSSLKKGESLLDTLLNLESMGFSMFVIRHGYRVESLLEISKKIQTPIINAGEGTTGHPTQALLDAYTIYKNSSNFKKEKILFVGDIVHSRVVSSNVELLKKIGIEYAFCGPESFLPKSNSKKFSDFNEGLEWATTVMCLRNQFERHQDNDPEKIKKVFQRDYCLDKKRIKFFKKDGLVLHPGPFNRDVEIASDILSDKRIKIFEQVTYGRKIRATLIKSILG